jgi:hypothetical protein
MRCASVKLPDAIITDPSGSSQRSVAFFASPSRIESVKLSKIERREPSF